MAWGSPGLAQVIDDGLPRLELRAAINVLPLNELFSIPDAPYLPLHTPAPLSDNGTSAPEEPVIEEGAAGLVPLRLSTRQFRHTLAWHIAHQPFGVVAGARQYQHAELALLEAYAGTAASGFAAEVAAERAIAQLDYVKDPYGDWNDGHRTSGAAAGRVNTEFAPIRRELGDLLGIVASPARLRTMLQHLTKTLHPESSATASTSPPPPCVQSGPSTRVGPCHCLPCA